MNEEELPALDPGGYLPPGIHVATLEQVRQRFGLFRDTDRRPRLFQQLADYVELARSAGCIDYLLIDGSFVTAKPAPEDIDLVAVLDPQHDLSTDLPPDAYNALSHKRARKMFGLDVFAAPEGSETLRKWTDLFSQVKGEPNARKGIVRVTV